MNSSDLKMQNTASLTAGLKTTVTKRKSRGAGKKLVQGVGVNDLTSDISIHYSDGTMYVEPFYDAWCSMLKRCYSEAYKRRFPTYDGCSVSEEWLILSKFKEWHDINYVDGWHLDKDLLVEGNKVYGLEFCRYVPRDLNAILNSRAAARGKYPQGVCFHKATGKLIAEIKVNGKSKHLGLFTNEVEAREVYLKAKARYVISKAESYRGVVCDEILDSLINRFNK